MNSRLARLRNRAQRCVEIPNTRQLVDTQNGDSGTRLSCNSGDNGKISKEKLISGGSGVRLSAAMRCAGVINRSFGGRWEYINKESEIVKQDEVEEEVLDEIIETIISSTGLTITSGSIDGILPSVLGRIVTDTSYNTNTSYKYILDENSPVSYSLMDVSGTSDFVLYVDNSSNLVLKTHTTKYINPTYFLDFIFFDISLNTDVEELVLISNENNEQENYITLNQNTFHIIFGKYYDLSGVDLENKYYKLTREGIIIGKIQNKIMETQEIEEIPEPEPEPEEIIEYILKARAYDCGFTDCRGDYRPDLYTGEGVGTLTWVDNESSYYKGWNAPHFGIAEIPICN